MVEPWNVGVVAADPGTTLDQEHPVIRQWIYSREMLRRLGYPAKDLYIAMHPIDNKPGMFAVGLALRVDDQEFEWLIGAIDRTPEEIEAFYEQLVLTFQRGELRWNIDEFFSSWAFSKRIELLVELQRRGLWRGALNSTASSFDDPDDRDHEQDHQ